LNGVVTGVLAKNFTRGNLLENSCVELAKRIAGILPGKLDKAGRPRKRRTGRNDSDLFAIRTDGGTWKDMDLRLHAKTSHVRIALTTR